jgi:hypothetical protein
MGTLMYNMYMKTNILLSTENQQDKLTVYHNHYFSTAWGLNFCILALDS